MASSVQGLTNEQLMVEVQRGHQQALHNLYDRFVKQVYGMALQKLSDPGEAQSVTQDIFVRLWRGSNAYRPDSGNLAGWVLTFAHNRINDHYRRNRGNGDVPGALSYDPTSEPVPAGAASGAVAGEWAESLKARQALQGLSDEERQVVVMAYYQGNSQSEISQQLGVPLSTVKSRMRSAMASLSSIRSAGGTV